MNLIRLIKKKIYELLIVESKLLDSHQVKLKDTDKMSEFVAISNRGNKIHLKFYKETAPLVNCRRKKDHCYIYIVEAFIDNSFPDQVKVYNNKLLISVAMWLKNPDIAILSELLIDNFLDYILD